MKQTFALLAVAILLLPGCAGRSSQSAGTAPEPQQPWLCRGVDGEWQCQRGDSGGEQQRTAVAEPSSTQRTLATAVKRAPSVKRPETDSADNTPSAVTAPGDIAQAASQQPAGKIDTAHRPDLWTIQWAALSSNTAAQEYGRQYLSRFVDNYEIRHIRVNNRDYYILFSGRYANKGAASDAAASLSNPRSEAPFLRTLGSIAAVTVN
ncbi:MAG: hypothetical protein CMQ44_04935 [Gammaproteobacteria bacterium]|nr:hypothetical protein [Gammaproteobacteria bacterium]